MTWSPLIDQRTLNPEGNEDCGEACTAMVLEHLGHNVNPQDLLALHYGPTDENEMLAFCTDFGLTGCYLTSTGFDNNDKLVMALIHDNGNADPDVSGQYLHWIVVYGQDAQNVYCANPWGGRDIAYPLAQFNPAYIAGIVIPISQNTVTQPVPAPAPSPLPQEGADLLATISRTSDQSQHVFQVNNGALYHKVWSPNSNGWQNERLVADEPLLNEAPVVLETNGQLHVFATGADNFVRHCYQSDGVLAGHWVEEKLP